MQFSKDMEWFCNKIGFFFIFVDMSGSSHFCGVYFYSIYVINQDFQFLHWSLSLRVVSILLRSSHDCHKITSSCHILTLSLHKSNPVILIQENLSTAGSCSSCWLYSGVSTHKTRFWPTPLVQSSHKPSPKLVHRSVNSELTAQGSGTPIGWSVASAPIWEESSPASMSHGESSPFPETLPLPLNLHDSYLQLNFMQVWPWKFLP